MPRFEITSPDGKRFEITAPEGATQEQALEYAKSQFTQEGNRFDPSTGNLRYQASRAAKGLAGLLAIPATAIEAAQNAPFSSPVALASTLLPRQSGKQAQETIGGLLGYDPLLKPPSREAEVIGGISEFAGAGVLPGAGVVARAVHKAPAIAAEIGSTVLGGLGSEIAGLPGAVIGSLTGANFPALYSKARSLVSGVVPWLRDAASTTAPRELNAAIQAHPAAATNAAIADEVAQNLRAIEAGEFQPTLAGKTGAPGIIAREAQIAGASAEDLSRYAQRQAENQAVIQRAERSVFPGGTSPQRTAEGIKLTATSMLERKFDDLTKQREYIAKLMQVSPQQDVGRRLFDLRDKAQTLARDIRDKKIADVYQAADRAGIADSMDDVLAVVRKVGGDDANIFQNMPPIYAKVVREYASKQPELIGRSIDPELMSASIAATAPKPASFQEIHSLWKEANTQFAAAARSGDTQAMYYISQVKNTLKAKLDKFEKGGFGEVTDKFRDFNTFYATKYAPAFKEGVGGRMGASGRYGEVIKPEDVIGKFFTPSGLDDFNLIYGSNPQAQAVLADGVMGLFRNAAVKGGVINKLAAQNFIRNNGEALDKLPDIKAILSTPTAANEALLEQAARVKANQSKVTNSILSKLAGMDDVAPLVDRAMTDRKAMSYLNAIAFRGGESGRKEAARLIAERVPIAAGKAGVDPFTYIANNRAILEPALNRLGDNHFKNLLTIAMGKTILGRTEMPKGVGAPLIKDFMEELTGTGVQSIVSMGRATTITRQSSPINMLMVMLSKFGIKLRRDSADALMREAIYNPDMASTWAKAAQFGQLSIPESNKLLNHIAAAGIRIESTRDKGE